MGADLFSYYRHLIISCRNIRNFVFGYLNNLAHQLIGNHASCITWCISGKKIHFVGYLSVFFFGRRHFCSTAKIVEQVFYTRRPSGQAVVTGVSLSPPARVSLFIAHRVEQSHFSAFYCSSISSNVDIFFSYLVLPSFWTSRGDRCRPFSPPVLAFNFSRAKGSAIPLVVDFLSSVANLHSRAFRNSNNLCTIKVPSITSTRYALGGTRTHGSDHVRTRFEHNLIRHRGVDHTTRRQLSLLFFRMYMRYSTPTENSFFGGRSSLRYCCCHCHAAACCLWNISLVPALLRTRFDSVGFFSSVYVIWWVSLCWRSYRFFRYRNIVYLRCIGISDFDRCIEMLHLHLPYRTHEAMERNGGICFSFCSKFNMHYYGSCEKPYSKWFFMGSIFSPWLLLPLPCCCLLLVEHVFGSSSTTYSSSVDSSSSVYMIW